jgi:hypothetical protein
MKFKSAESQYNENAWEINFHTAKDPTVTIYAVEIPDYINIAWMCLIVILLLLSSSGWKTGAACPSGNLCTVYQTTRYHIPKECDLNIYHLTKERSRFPCAELINQALCHEDVQLYYS